MLFLKQCGYFPRRNSDGIRLDFVEHLLLAVACRADEAKITN